MLRNEAQTRRDLMPALFIGHGSPMNDYDLAKELAVLRKKGVLIAGSGKYGS